jgi:teichuronic acid biosynthesis glycosyltransferase TuaG
MSEALNISVVIPTYNRSTTLLQAVDSVLQQTYPVSEILICDDGSTDDSKEKVEKLNNPKIKWIDCGRNGAPAIPRNIGITKATGEWIAFLDSDDSWFPTKMYEQVQCILATSCLAVSSNARRYVGEKDMGDYLIYNKHSIRLTDLLWRNPVIISSLLVSKAILNQTPLFLPNQKHYAFEDYVLVFKISLLTKISFIKLSLVKYTDTPTASMRSDRNLSFYEQRKRATNDLLSWAKKNNFTFPFSYWLLIYFLNSPAVKIKYFLVNLLRNAAR